MIYYNSISDKLLFLYLQQSKILMQIKVYEKRNSQLV